MVNEVIMDALSVKTGILCHQTNYAGVMGGGIALAIKDKLLSEEQYAEYQRKCILLGSLLIADVQFMPCGDLIVANCFCQNAVPDDTGTLTNYRAMALCFERVESEAVIKGLSVIIPGYMGCGIAGGDWSTVRGIIDKTFKTARERVKGKPDRYFCVMLIRFDSHRNQRGKNLAVTQQK